jgi:hypothetical protein
MLRAETGQCNSGSCRVNRRALYPEPVAVVTPKVLIAECGERNTCRTVDLMIEIAEEYRRRMETEVSANGVATESRTLQPHRGRDGTSCNDDDGRFHDERARLLPGSRHRGMEALEGKGAAVLCELDAFDTRRGEDSRARASGAREKDLQRPLFGAVAATITAKTCPQAVLGVDTGRTRGPTEGAGAVEENAVVGRMGVIGHGASVDLLLDAIEHGSEISGRHSFHAVPHGPLIEHPLGCPKHDHPIHRRTAAERGALQQRNREIVSRAKAAIGVEAFLQLSLALGEILSAQRLTLLKDEHVVSGFGEACRRDGAAGTGTHDDDLGAEHRVATWGIRLPGG